MSRALRLGLLAATTLLTGCPGGDGTPPQQLQSITVTDAQGTVLSVSRFDYDSDGLARVRAYSEPGNDGVVGTADDPLAGGGYAACSMVPANGLRLYDPHAEETGNNRLARLFSVQASCALPDLSAASVTSTFITSPGLDGQWFTSDDEGQRRLTLSRTSEGSQLQESWVASTACGFGCAPVNTSYNLNATGLNNIVYNPYAGLGAAPPPPTPIHYALDADGRVTGLESEYYTQRVEYGDDGVVTLRELILPAASADPSSNALVLLINPGRFRDEYSRLDASRTAVTSYALVQKSAYDVYGASPTGQILLAIMGLAAEGEITLDGVTYVKAGLIRYLVDRSAGDVETVARLVGPGSDGEWFSSDDSILQTATLRFASVAPPAGLRGRTEASR